MTKQRLAEIMLEIQEGVDELNDNGTSAILLVQEKKGEDSHIAMVGGADDITAEKMACALLITTWAGDGMLFSEHMERFASACLLSLATGRIKKEEE